MKFHEVMRYYDYKVSNIMRHVKASREAIRQWKANDKIPFKSQCVLEVMTDGGLRANKEDNI